MQLVVRMSSIFIISDGKIFGSVIKRFIIKTTILRFNKNGKIIWKFDSNKTLNSPLKIIDEQIIALYVDEINLLDRLINIYLHTLQ